MIVSDLCPAPGHLLLSDGWQGLSGQFESVHDGLKSFECERGTVVVHFYDPEGKERTNSVSIIKWLFSL